MGEEVLAGTFFLNDQPIIILFDSGASHDFYEFHMCQEGKVNTCSIGNAICD
jgi:hypothetical protein